VKRGGEVHCHRLTFRGDEMRSVSKIFRSSSAASCASRVSCVTASSDAIPLPSSNVRRTAWIPAWISRAGRNERDAARPHRESDIPAYNSEQPCVLRRHRRRGASAQSGVVKHRRRDGGRPIEIVHRSEENGRVPRFLRREPRFRRKRGSCGETRMNSSRESQAGL